MQPVGRLGEAGCIPEQPIVSYKKAVMCLSIPILSVAKYDGKILILVYFQSITEHNSQFTIASNEFWNK
jgi:hypothetical protein